MKADNRILIYSPELTPRLSYIVDFLFTQLLSTDYEFITNVTLFSNSPLPKINYSSASIGEHEIHIPPVALLFEKGIRIQEINLLNKGNLTCFFENNSFLGFDIFAASFYLLSRYEEYLPFKPDQHGRFPASESLAYNGDFLQIPIIHHWAALLKKRLNQLFPSLYFPSAHFTFHPTFDVDLAWAYLHKGLFRTTAHLVKDLLTLDFKQLRRRLKVLTYQESDPFFVFDELKIIHQKYQISPIFFFLLGDYGKFDKNIPYYNHYLQNLIKTINIDYKTGIHPSYASNEQPQQLKKEIKRLNIIIKKDILLSRQHFLKLSLPTTYQQLINNHIQHDYSMGYAEQTGFRASVAQPFLWYNLKMETTTNLWIHPFQVMDVTLKDYLKLTPEEGLERTKKIIDNTVEVNGNFTLLWHNSSFSALDNWQEWKWVYEEILKYAIAKENQQ